MCWRRPQQSKLEWRLRANELARAPGPKLARARPAASFQLAAGRAREGDYYYDGHTYRFNRMTIAVVVRRAIKSVIWPGGAPAAGCGRRSQGAPASGARIQTDDHHF